MFSPRHPGGLLSCFLLTYDSSRCCQWCRVLLRADHKPPTYVATAYLATALSSPHPSPCQVRAFASSAGRWRSDPRDKKAEMFRRSTFDVGPGLAFLVLSKSPQKREPKEVRSCNPRTSRRQNSTSVFIPIFLQATVSEKPCATCGLGLLGLYCCG
ncbi:hypothetical protein FPQ18DRAFT_347797 [Pyronema domesticum]|nr:hypothetical protein FPQ18DRAFT_347797 [Pyronema domesticum]